MNSVLLIVAILLAVLILWLAVQISQSQKKGSALESQLTELRRDLLSVAQTQSQSAGQIQSIGQTVSQRLEGVTKALQDGVTNSAQITTQGQTAIATELKNTREQIGLIQKQIGEVQDADGFIHWHGWRFGHAANSTGALIPTGIIKPIWG